MNNKYILFNGIKFYMSHELYDLSVLLKIDYLKIWHDKSKKKMTFEIKREFDFDLGVKIGCWECVSHRQDNYGYPGFMLKGRMIKMHRFMYCLFNDIQYLDKINKKTIRHECDNRLCSNPDHLVIGTHKQNMQDMKDRGRSLRGENNPSSRLTEIDILYIRDSEVSLAYLSNMYGVSKSTIRKIEKRQLWNHVKDSKIDLEINI